MDFTKSIWKGNQGICNKSEWSKANGLTWDGVTNNIRVPCKGSTGLVERNYLIIQNTNYAKQFDIGSNPDGETVSSQLDCENICDSTAGCNGFSYNEKEGKCALKNIKKGTEIPSYSPNSSTFVTSAGYKSYMDADNICSSEKGDGKCSVLKNNKCKAMLKEDGNVLIYDIANKPLWASNTYNKGNGPYSMKMQDDGNLVVYDVNNEEIWSSGTTDKGDGPYRAELDDSCTLTVYDSKNKNLWFGNESNAVKQEVNSCSSDINYGLCLKTISSVNARLIMQDDGNLCVYDNSNKLLWQSGSNGRGTPPYRLMMQTDGNLVIYDSQNKATWATGTNGMGRPPYKLKLRKDMSLEIKSATGLIWTNKYRKLDNTDYPGQFDITNGGGSLLDGQNSCSETDGCNALFYQDSTKRYWLKNVKLGTERPGYNRTGSMYVTSGDFKSYKEGFTSSMSPEIKEEDKASEEDPLREVLGYGNNGSSEADLSKEGFQMGDNGGVPREGFKTWRDIQYTKIEKTDYTGQFDIKSAAGTVDQCKELCTTTDGCNGFAFRGNNCWLKSIKKGTEVPKQINDVDTYVMGDGVGYKSYKDIQQDPNSCASNVQGGLCKTMNSNTATAVMQDDANFVVYQKGGGAVWASYWNPANRGVGPYRLYMQSDGNAVVYDSKGVPTWASNTAGKGVGPYTLILNDDKSLEIWGKDNYGKSLKTWSSMRDLTSKFEVIRNTSTGYTPEFNTLQLKNLDVNCGGDVLNQFHLQRDYRGNYKYDFTCSTAAINRGSEWANVDRAYDGTSRQYTAPIDNGKGNLTALSKHNVDCGSDVISQFRLDTAGDVNVGLINYNYTCKKPKNPLKSCRTVTTGENDAGGGNSIYLDRHNISCAADEALSSFKLNNKSVKLYEHCDYGGKEWVLSPGNYNNYDMNRLGIPSNIISSVRVPPGLAVTLYSGPFLNGEHIRITEDVSCLVNYTLKFNGGFGMPLTFVVNFNDKTNSFKIEGRETILYEYKCCKF